MLSLLVIVAVVVAAVGASAQRNQDCIHQLTRPNCLGVTNCCWHTGGLHMATTHQATCVSCITLKASHKTALQSLWQKWEYNRDGGLPDANVDNILCPNLGTVANHRVSCNDDGELTDLTLGNDGLYGEMAHLCELSPGPGGPQDTIETLTLAGNFLWGPLPACANTFTRVKQFWIDHNFLRGQLPNIRDLANINTLAVSDGKSDCRIVSFNYLTAEFGPDNNCFSCAGGFDDLPPACAPTDQWPNACNIYQNTKDVTCPSDNGMPERPSSPTAPPTCGTATGTEGCPCNADGSCNQGSGFAVECTAANLCVKGSTLPLRCQADPASIGCPCNAQTGKCKDDTLVCKEPEVICVQSASRASLSLALVAAFALLAVLFA